MKNNKRKEKHSRTEKVCDLSRVCLITLEGAIKIIFIYCDGILEIRAIPQPGGIIN